MTKFVTGTNWSPKDVAIAASMWQQLADDTYGEDVPFPVKRRVLEGIALRLNRQYFSVYQRFRDHGPSFNAGSVANRKMSPQALAQRDARREAGYAASITAQVFGDPPPGFSELDKRNARGLPR